MKSIRSLALALVVAFALPIIAFGQLPGPPVGAPQANQSTSIGYNFQYSFVPSSTTGAGFAVNPTLNLTTATSQNDDLFKVLGSVVLPNSSASATQATAMHVGTLTCTANSGTITTCANAVIDAAPSGGGTNNYSLWSKGLSRLDASDVRQAITASASATPTLTAPQCGGIFLWDRASGTNYTLPVPVAGCTFDFINSVAQSSGTNEVQSSGATVFIQGGPIVSGTTANQFACNGSTHVAIKTNDSTTGGLLGGHVRFTALTATLWQLDGTLVGSGTVATPCTATP